MKNKLTINRLAAGNLRARKKQYTIMIIGIILAMFFSTSIVLFFASANETKTESNKLRYGMQNGIAASNALTEDDFKSAKKDEYISDYFLLHYLGYAYTDEGSKSIGAPVCWMDEEAWKIYNLRFLEGEYPKSGDEVAIEQNELKRLGYKEARLGDIITLSLDVENSDITLDKQYKLVGIVSDRRVYMQEDYFGDDTSDPMQYDTIIPAIYVARGTPVDAGGRERLGCLYLSDYKKKFADPSAPDRTYSESSAVQGYFYSLGAELDEVRFVGYRSYGIESINPDELFDGGSYYIFVIIALVFASCVAIVNAFNTNLKERKRQIGLFRAVGTTKRQIIKIFGREALIISLIATPISILLSYIVVRVLLSIISDNAVMSKSIDVLVIAAVVDIAVVMLAALVPLVVAARTTPMQAIRNIDINRKVRTKRIKSKKQFKAPSHLASRYTKFYKGSMVTVSVMLVVTICFSCVAFSFVTYSMQNIRRARYDYTLHVNEYDSKIGDGITNVDRQKIEELPYVDTLYSGKMALGELELEELNDFSRILDYGRYEVADRDPESPQDFKKIIEAGPYDDYAEEKKALGIEKEMCSARLQGYDNEIIKGIEGCVVSGKIDYKALSSGDEVVLIVPKKAELTAKIASRFTAVRENYDEDTGKQLRSGYELIYSAESDYKVGDTLTFYTAEKIYDTKLVSTSTLDGETNMSYADEYYEDKITYKPHSKSTVKVGAIIRPNSLDYYKNGVSSFAGITLLTNLDGINRLVKGLNYSELRFNVNVPLDDETDLNIRNDLVPYNDKYYGGFFESSYNYEQFQIKETRSMLTAVVALIIIGFVICISIINNSISAQIRENKRVIGTLRAVGADKKDLVSSYLRRMLAMFAWGTGIGYGLFIVITLVLEIVKARVDVSYVEFIFNPWITVAMTVLSFAVCAINVYTKISKEMKNSIVENIREL